MENQEIIIPITTTTDPSQLLDITIELSELLLRYIESYGDEAIIHLDKICVKESEQSINQ